MIFPVKNGPVTERLLVKKNEIRIVQKSNICSKLIVRTHGSAKILWRAMGHAARVALGNGQWQLRRNALVLEAAMLNSAWDVRGCDPVELETLWFGSSSLDSWLSFYTRMVYWLINF